jgi:hypothetical protein
MPKTKTLKSNNPLNKMTIYKSSAATLKTTVYGYKDFYSFYINGQQPTLANGRLVADDMYEGNASIARSITSVLMNGGDSLSWGGEGGGPDQHLLSTKYCYTFRLADVAFGGTQTEDVQIGKNKETVRAYPTSGMEQHYWHYICAESSNFSVKSGGPIYLFRVDIIETYHY